MFRFIFLSDRKEEEGVRGVAGCNSTREARVPEGSKMPLEVAVEEEVEEEEVVTVHMLLCEAVTRR